MVIRVVEGQKVPSMDLNEKLVEMNSGHIKYSILGNNVVPEFICLSY